jgi:prepilin-type N-terminal cleavage/methylation domain-containing protein
MRTVHDQRGFTLVELLVSTMASLVVLSAVVTMMTSALHNQDRISRRVDANQRVRPVMTRIVQELHSACVAPRITPIIGDGTTNGSTGTRISFLSKSGSGVTLTPDLHVISLSGGSLTEYVYPATSGAAPGPWTFSGTAIAGYNPRQLLTNVSAPASGMFQYYDFVNGQVDTSPTAVPLSATDAAKAAIIKVTISSSPTKGVSSFDPGSPLVVSNTADLRLENAGQYPNQDNLPCV